MLNKFQSCPTDTHGNIEMLSNSSTSKKGKEEREREREREGEGDIGNVGARGSKIAFHYC